MKFHSYLCCLLATLSVFRCQAQDDYPQFVKPMIGSEGLGHIFVGPSAPFGMAKPGPDCGNGSNSGYQPSMNVPVTGFSQTHLSGTGGGPKYGNIQLMPFEGDGDSLNQSSLRQDEKAQLAYYRVFLKRYGIKAELTTAELTAFHQYTYSGKASRGIKIDPGFFLGEQKTPDSREAQQFVGSEIEVVSDSAVRGYSRIRGGWNNGAAYAVYFYAVFDHPIDHFTTWKSGNFFKNAKKQFDSGEKTGVMLHFTNSDDRTIKVKVGISFMSELKAADNIQKDIPGWDFELCMNKTRAAWAKLFSRIEIAPATPLNQKIMFYTALYHTMLMPVDRSGENPLWNGDEPYYDDFYAIWDTFRCSNPLITLVDPNREIAIVNALLSIYHHDGYMPDARSGNFNGRTQGGSNAEVLIADAYVKGLKGIDYKKGLEAMLKDANMPPGGIEEKEGRGGLTDYNSKGYVSSNFVRAGNRTVDYAYDDYCIAELAKDLGREALYKRFIRQASNWKNLWRDEYADEGSKGFIMPKDPEGKWLDSVKYGESPVKKYYFKYGAHTREFPRYVCWWCGFFYEGTSWEYSFSIPHEVPELIRLSGGNEAFMKKLNTFFDRHYFNVANEPSFLTPDLYHWIGRPDLSTARIHDIISSYYSDQNNGIPGNDDSGAMSSWLDFHMMGFYPNAGQPYYLLNAPLLSKSVLHEQNGKDFAIVAKDFSAENKYVKAVYLNGRRLDRAWISHEEVLQGGILEFQMASKPNETWGSKILPPLHI